MQKEREQLNKMLDYRLSKILEVDNESFDPSFAEQMADKLENGDELTPSQISAINNIYDSWVKE